MTRVMALNSYKWDINESNMIDNLNYRSYNPIYNC
jgi:hypothetical protein